MFRAVEDRPTPKEVFGYDSAFVGTIIAQQSFVNAFNIVESEAADISSNITIRRKWALQANTLLFLIGAVVMTAATHQLTYIYAGRALTGIACGAITATVPSYIAELSIVSIRGILTGFFEVAYQIGSLVGFWINYGINENMDTSSAASWRVPMAVQIIPACILFIGGFFLHGSPLWLVRKDREDDAATALEALRKFPRSHPYVQDDIEMIRTRLLDESRIAERYGQGWWAYIRGALFELSSSPAINYYSPTLFSSLGITDVALYTGVYELVKAVASIIFYGVLIDMWGRRRPTIISSLACSLCLWFVGAYVKVVSPSTEAVCKAATAMIMIYSVFWSFGLNGIPWFVSAEIFPGARRNRTGTWAALVQWLIQFVITKALPYIFKTLGYGTWFFFASWMMLATIWSFFMLTETKGKTLDELDTIFPSEDGTYTPSSERTWQLIKDIYWYFNQALVDPETSSLAIWLLV
ncbi:hypothetical protein BDW75DRAFT_248048 [Aspergillus navahoensis]